MDSHSPWTATHYGQATHHGQPLAMDSHSPTTAIRCAKSLTTDMHLIRTATPRGESLATRHIQVTTPHEQPPATNSSSLTATLHEQPLDTQSDSLQPAAHNGIPPAMDSHSPTINSHLPWTGARQSPLAVDSDPPQVLDRSSPGTETCHEH